MCRNRPLSLLPLLALLALLALGAARSVVAGPAAAGGDASSDAVTATYGTATYGGATYGTATYGPATYGPAAYGPAASGTAASGAATSGTAASGTATAGTAASGAAASGAAMSGAAGGAHGMHSELFAASRFPTAEECRSCHPRHYREWSVSQHAYAMISPVFNAMQARITELTNGTNGDFCIRCHTGPGMALGEPTVMPVLERSRVAQEGVTCISCHRQNEAHGKFSARVAVVEGDLTAPVSGPTGDAELRRLLADPSRRLITDTDGAGPGRVVHGEIEPFFHLTTPAFCGTCHDVTLPDGFRLEEAFSEYKTSHAATEGTRCQDCHMGRVPGDPDGGFDVGPAAVVGGVATRERKLTNHMVVGPDHSIVHPALFPHSPEIRELATLEQWLAFDWEAGWGTDGFEDAVSSESEMEFPEPWDSVDARYEARELIDDQIELLDIAFERGRALLQRGYSLGEVEIERASERGLRFSVDVGNPHAPHNVPTGFTAERLVFLRVTVTDADGRVAFRSGDLDANGDLRDLHSALVAAGKAPRDRQLFSLQSKFMTRNLRGSEREQVLAVNQSMDALPFVRPETVPTVLTGRPRGARIHKQGIPPGEAREAAYSVRGRDLGPAPWTIEVELVAGMVPVNLVHAIQDAGFDFRMSAEEVAREIVEGHRVLARRVVTVGGGGGAVVGPAGPAGP